MNIIRRIITLTPLLLILTTTFPVVPANATECAGQTVAQCANGLAKTIYDLKNENTALIKRIDDMRTDQAKALDALRKELMSVLPKPTDFYFKNIPQALHPTPAISSCEAGDILISAACSSAGGRQAAVGPLFSSVDNVKQVQCLRYGAEALAEGVMICMKHH